jgi:hypothetical protein
VHSGGAREPGRRSAMVHDCYEQSENSLRRVRLVLYVSQWAAYRLRFVYGLPADRNRFGAAASFEINEELHDAS